MIFILEDNDQRIDQFRGAISRFPLQISVRFWHDANRMINDLVDGLQEAKLISLDHDLVPEQRDSADPGTGYDVIKLLVELLPCCPLIIHTSNAERRSWMIGELDRTQWVYESVYPFEDDWIENDWSPVAQRLLAARQ